jgi:hypothetical protein
MFAKAQQTDYDFFDVTGICVYYRKNYFVEIYYDSKITFISI